MMFSLRCLSLALLAVALCSAGGCVAEDVPRADEEVVVMTVTCENPDKVKVKKSEESSETDCETAGEPYTKEFCKAVKEKCPKDTTTGAITPASLNVTAKKKDKKYTLESAVKIEPPLEDKKVEKGPQGDTQGQQPRVKQPNGSEVQHPNVDQNGVDSTDSKSRKGNAGGSADGAGALNPEEKETSPSATTDKPTLSLPTTNRDTQSEPESFDGSDITVWARVPLLFLLVALAYIVAC